MSLSLESTFIQHFACLSDPRVERTKHHLLIDIIAIAILAVISGADGWVAIETYGQAKKEWLATFLSLPNGIPSHDTFARVFARIEPSEFEKCFNNWINTITEELGAQVIPIDGKTLRGSYDREAKQKPLTVVSAWASNYRLVLGQFRVNDKSNEITAIPQLLKMLNISGSIITIDAIGCQKSIATLICHQGADYVLALKGNQGKLYNQVEQFFKQARAAGFSGIEHSYYHSTESSHGRIEIRHYYSVPLSVLTGLSQQDMWTGLASVGMVICERRLGKKTTIEVRYYLSSLKADAQVLAHAVRTHWGVENSVHWIIDVTFKEDASRIRTAHSAQNFALLRRIALNQLERETTVKSSIRQKRYRAALDNQYAVKVLLA
ncbi:MULTISPECIES: ISAs1 family transposase [unclassified Coleofasciculus]|uniref:ISAs1 family transposase n=1 Tax=unclassified Coleofasciculus TaxID=2692782 RepID=UPI001883024F|nr:MULTISPECIES: ISAs1 family transposase [unclassified Coleofasciculus]MBE9130220.1 ISAs1 family transposase [Coleofasciculus sp. LEGE 07081]MBE9152520.1 ISAs1 family transposase [Coleofasciculus sp. LEGE 07092]